MMSLDFMACQCPYLAWTTYYAQHQASYSKYSPGCWVGSLHFPHWNWNLDHNLLLWQCIGGISTRNWNNGVRYGITYLFIGIRLHTIMGEAREVRFGRKRLEDKSKVIIHQGPLSPWNLWRAVAPFSESEPDSMAGLAMQAIWKKSRVWSKRNQGMYKVKLELVRTSLSGLTLPWTLVIEVIYRRG